MSKFLYPRDLYRSLHKVWNASPFTTGWPPIALPEQQTLNQLLDVCYHASFLVEESRPVTFRAVFLEHTTQIKPLEAGQSHPTELYLFDAPVPFTAEEVRQVAPAADLTSVWEAARWVSLVWWILGRRCGRCRGMNGRWATGCRMRSLLR